MEDPSGDDFSQLTDQLTEQINGLLNGMLPVDQASTTATATITPNGQVNFRMIYQNPFSRLEPTRPEYMRNLGSSLAHNITQNIPRSPFFSRRFPLAPLFRQTTLSDILRHSMENVGGTKQVASDELLESIAGLPEVTDISADEECPICMEGYADGSGIRVECSHLFHRDCITEWFKGDHRCPVCRHEYPSKEISLAPVTDAPAPQEDRQDDNPENVDEVNGEMNEPVDESSSDSDIDAENAQQVDSLENVFGNATLNSAVRSLENMLRDTFTNTFAEQLQEERLIQQAIFDSLREPMPMDDIDVIEPHDISGSNNGDD